MLNCDSEERVEASTKGVNAAAEKSPRKRRMIQLKSFSVSASTLSVLYPGGCQPMHFS